MSYSSGKNKRVTWTRYIRWNFAQTTNNNDNKPPGFVPRFHQTGFCSFFFFLIVRFQVNFFPLRANTAYYMRALHSRLDIVLHASRARPRFYREITFSLLFIPKCWLTAVVKKKNEENVYCQPGPTERRKPFASVYADNRPNPRSRFSRYNRLI